MAGGDMPDHKKPIPKYGKDDLYRLGFIIFLLIILGIIAALSPES